MSFCGSIVLFLSHVKKPFITHKTFYCPSGYPRLFSLSLSQITRTMGNMCAQNKVSKQLRTLCHEKRRDSYRIFGFFFFGGVGSGG